MWWQWVPAILACCKPSPAEGQLSKAQAFFAIELISPDQSRRRLVGHGLNMA
jgi:hypothetical protein